MVFTEIINGKVTEHNLCMECARKSDFGQHAAFVDGGSQLGRLLSGLLGMALGGNGEANAEDGQNVVCPVCKTSYKDFVNRSRFGCADCYDVFELLMEDHIKNLQGNTNHVGKRPMKVKSRVEKEKNEMNDISAEDKSLLKELFEENIFVDGAQKEPADQVTAQSNGHAIIGNAGPGEDLLKRNEETASVQTAVNNPTEKDPAAIADEKNNQINEQINVMKRQLQKALEEENYMGAAHLRDQIHELEASLKEGGASV